MSRPLEEILFGNPSPQAQTAMRAVSVATAAVLLLLAAGIVFRFHTAGQLDARFWEFFAWRTTWAFLAKGLLGTLASAAMAAAIALSLGLVLLLGRLAGRGCCAGRASRSSSFCGARRRCCSSMCVSWCFRRSESS